jgi:DNA-binding GntR family transcriptional regulator
MSLQVRGLHASNDLVQIDPDSPEFPYLQLAGILRERIADGTYTSKIPPLVELEDEFGLATMTVRRAISVLVDEGLLRRVPGRGTYVQRG